MAVFESNYLGNLRRRGLHKPIPDFTPCGYCFQRWAVVWDHIKPYSKGGLTTPDNLYPSCRQCNAMLSDSEFSTLGEKREYVRQTLIEKGKWLGAMPDLPEPVHQTETTSAVLQYGLPKKSVRSKQGQSVCSLPETIPKDTSASVILLPEMPLASLAAKTTPKIKRLKRQRLRLPLSPIQELEREWRKIERCAGRYLKTVREIFNPPK
jgi:HNH endonuclease